VGSGFNNIAIRAIGGTIKWRRKGTPDVVETLLGDIGDIDKVDLGGIGRDKNIRTVYDTVRHLVELEKGERLVGGSMWGPFTIAGLIYGAENLMRGVGNKDAAIDRLLKFSSELYLAYMQGYIDAGARVIFMAEPSASGDMISRAHFQNHVVPYIREIYRRLAGKGLVVGLHICGDTSDRLDLIADSGAQIMSLDYKVDLAVAKQAFAGKIAFSGNLNPVDVVQLGTPEEIRAKTLEAIETVGTHSSYIVMPGCDIPPSTPTENLQIISETVNRYQG
jgi:uroporphyrinogen decarboxylase